MAVDVVLNFQALPGHANELLVLLIEGRDLSRAADGCETFEVFQGEDARTSLCSWSAGHPSTHITRTWPSTSSRVGNSL
jgi:quinol monooxygenase YgiN